VQCFVKEIHFCRVLTSLIKHLAFCICLHLFLLRVFCLVHVYIFCYLFIFVFLSSIPTFTFSIFYGTVCTPSIFSFTCSGNNFWG